jgi:hypothetical protein
LEQNREARGEISQPRDLDHPSDSLGGSGCVTVAVLIGRPVEEVGRLGQIGTAAGFIVGVPTAIVTVWLLSS